MGTPTADPSAGTTASAAGQNAESSAENVRHVGEREARQTAEAARETDWRQPSFGKQLFLGDYRLDLIHPHPRPGEAAAARGEEFCAKMRAFCEESVDGAQI